MSSLAEKLCSAPNGVEPDEPLARPDRATIPELPPLVTLAGLAFRPVSRAELIEAICLRAEHQVRTSVHYLNAHVFNMARRDPQLHELLSACDLLYADGISIVWAARLLGYTVPCRLTAADYFVEFCRRCADQGLRLFLLGGAPGVAQAAAKTLARAAPGLEIAGTSHGYLTPAESLEQIRRIDAGETDILIVGMSSPLQERWISEYAGRTQAAVHWSVGALLDYFAGVERRAPAWMCRCHGEWLFRLWVNPSQRWRRYVLGNASFAWWLAGQCLMPGRSPGS